MRADIVSGALLAAIGGYAGWQAWGFGLGVLSQPGAGFFPFIGALMIGVCGIAIAIKAVGRGAAMPAAGEPAEPALGGWKLWACIAGLIAYTVALPILGFAISTFLVLLGLSRLDRNSSWPAALGIAVLGSAGFWLVFVRGLGVNFPPSLIGI
ncbi:MAG: tripartite tricarboxylate transporter TctB family protein [Clostridia bacterium]